MGMWGLAFGLVFANLTFAGGSAGETAYCTILDKLHKFGPPVLKVISLLIALGAVIGGFVEFARRQLGWFIGILIVGLLIAMALYALAGVADNTLSDVLKSAGCS